MRKLYMVYLGSETPRYKNHVDPQFTIKIPGPVDTEVPQPGEKE